MKQRQQGASIYKPVGRVKASGDVPGRGCCTLEVFTRKLGALI